MKLVANILIHVCCLSLMPWFKSCLRQVRRLPVAWGWDGEFCHIVLLPPPITAGYMSWFKLIWQKNTADKQISKTWNPYPTCLAFDQEKYGNQTIVQFKKIALSCQETACPAFLFPLKGKVSDLSVLFFDDPSAVYSKWMRQRFCGAHVMVLS